MTLPTTWDGAVALIGQLVGDPLLGLGLVTVGLILVVSGAITWALVALVSRANR